MTDRTDPTDMTDRIDRELVVPAALEELWRLITEDGWLADRVEFEFVPGGEARFITGQDERTGWVEDVRSPDQADEDEPGGHLVFWWSWDGEPASRVELRLEPEGENSTRLSLTESRPLEVLDLIGMPLPESGGGAFGPSLLVAA